MFNAGLTLIALVVLAALSAGALAYSLLFRRVNNEQIVAAALARSRCNGARSTAPERRSLADIGARRKNIQDSIKELEQKQKAALKQKKTPPLTVRIQLPPDLDEEDLLHRHASLASCLVSEACFSRASRLSR